MSQYPTLPVNEPLNNGQYAPSGQYPPVTNQMDAGPQYQAQVSANDTQDNEKNILQARIDSKKTVPQALITKLQWINVVSYIICMIINGISNVVSPKTQKQIVAEWDILISPAGWAFAIWGIIYTMIGVFVVYQALPAKWVTSRNDELIFGKIGMWFAYNMISNAVWLLIFGQDNKWAFTLSFIDILALYYTGQVILRIVDRNHCQTKVEYIFLRGGFSIYMGWVTAATILNIAFMLKSWGLKGDFEVTVSVIILWIALVIYIIYSFFERNPLFGLIYIWVLFAIRDFEHMHSPIVSTCSTLLVIHGIYIVALTVYCLWQKPKTHGLFY